MPSPPTLGGAEPSGLVYGFRTYDWSVISVEASWVQRGAESVRLDYVEIPLLVGGVLRTGSQQQFRIRGYTGIGVGFKVSCSATLDATCESAKTTQWNWPVGLQLGVWTQSKTFVAADVRFGLTFTNAFDVTNAWNRGWQFKAAIGRAIGL